MATERIFFAVHLPVGVVERIERALDPAWREAFPGRIAPASNWHLTLRFVGSVEGSVRERLVEFVARTSLPRPPQVRIGRWGCFPRPAAARVFWLGIDDPSGGLRRLVDRLESMVREIGLPPETRLFRPHITIGRLTRPADLRALVSRIPAVGGTLPWDAVELVRSDLGRGPPRYTCLERFHLG